MAVSRVDPRLDFERLLVTAAASITGGGGSLQVADSSVAYLVSLGSDLAHLERWLASLLHRPPGEGPTEYQLAAVGNLPPQGLTMAGFASALGIGGPAATAVSDRLVRAGAVVRYRDPEDRRVVRIVATESGAAAAAAYRLGQLQALAGVVGEATPERYLELSARIQELVQLLRTDLPPPGEGWEAENIA